MKIEERKVAIRDLKVGMYVCRLDREWGGTPFALQGVMVESEDDIALLAQYCSDVYIDTELSTTPAGGAELSLLPQDREPAELRKKRTVTSYAPADVEQKQNQVAYVDASSLEDELPQARQAQQRVAVFAARMLEDVREGRQISHQAVHAAVEPMVYSIVRNADAFLWLETLRERGSYDYGHALNCSGLAAAFGRHIGFPQEMLADMAIAGLLLDIGKQRVPEGLLDRAGRLQGEEIEEAQRHVAHCLAILDEDGSMPSHVRDMIAGHHERHDGTGYPERLSGDDIPLLARIAAVIDSYDAMTSDRAYRKGVSRHVALQELYRQRDTLYSAEIVEQFLQCMGVYPTGSLVELGSGEVAVVMGQNAARRLLPKIMMLTDSSKVLLSNFRAVDLMAQVDGAGNLGGFRIAALLEPGAYGLDPAELFL